MANDMRFSLIGDDRLSPALNHAGDSALAMAGRIQVAATEADLAMAGLTRDLEHRVRDAEGRVVPEADALGRAIGSRIGSGMQAALSDLRPAIEIVADDRPADRRVHLLVQRIEALRAAQIGVDIQPDEAIEALAAIRTEAERLSRTHPDVVVQAHLTNALQAIDSMRVEVDRLDTARATITVDVDAARALAETEAVHEAVRRLGDDDGPDRARSRFGALGSVIGGVGGALGRVGMGASRVALIGGTALQAVPLVAGLITTIEQIGPAAAVAATGMAAAGLAAGALELGMAGVGDAIKGAFNPSLTKAGAKQLEQTMQALAPAARQFVLQLRTMRPALVTLQKDVQQNVFFGLSSSLKDLGTSALPLVRRQLLAAGLSLNTMAHSVIQTATALADDGTLGRALGGANKGLRNLVGIPGQVVNALGELAAAAAPSFVKLTSEASKAAGKIMGKLDAAFNSGAMQQAIQTAVGLVGQLGHVLGNVGTIFKNVLGAAGTAGGNLVGVLGTVTNALAKATALPGVQAALRALFTIMNEIGKVAGPLLVKAFALIGPVITTLAPSVLRLIDALGAGLQPIITALGPVLVAAAGAVGSLLDAVSPLLPVVGQMIASFGPVLTPILKIVGGLFAAVAPVLAQLGTSLLPPVAAFTKTLATAFQLLAPVLQTALTQLGTQGLTPIIQGLGQVLGQIVTQYSAAFLNLFQQLLPLVPQVTPLLIQVGQSIGQILSAVAPLVPQLALMGVQFVTAVLPAILPLIPPLAQLTVLLLQLATGVITKVVIPALKALTTAVGWIGSALTGTVRVISGAVQEIVKPFKWLYDTLLGHSIIPDTVNGIVTWFGNLPGRAVSALGNIASRLGGVMQHALDRMINAVSTGLKAVVSWIGDLPSRAGDALGDLSSTLYHSGRALIRGFIDGMSSMLKTAKDTAGSILGAVKDFFPNSPAKVGPFSGRGWTHFSGMTVIEDWAGGMSASGHTAVSAVQRVAAAAAAAVPEHLALPGIGASAPGAGAPPAPGARTGPVQITVPGVGGIVLAKEIQRALLELKRVSGISISLEIA